MKKIKSALSHGATGKYSKAEEIPATYYTTAKAPSKQLITKDFLFSDFKKISDKAPFTIAEWAGILHISERTLHRYAHENASFNGMQIERILLTEQLINAGNQMFGKEGFKKWLKFKPFSLQFQTPISMLNTYDGIQQVINLIQRMQHGISA